MTPPASKVLDFPALRNPNFPVHKVACRLEPYLRAIVQNIRPEKIILFGSYAYGSPRWDSDFDLLVLRRGISNWTESNIEIRRALANVDAPRPSFTFLSRTPEEFEQEVHARDFLPREIAEKGLVLYAA